jgi:hypothetical protein
MALSYARATLAQIAIIWKERVMRRSLGAGTLDFTTPVWVVGTYDQDDKSKGVTAACGGICWKR